MSDMEIQPRSAAAFDMRSMLDRAEWMVVESEARGKPLSWDAAVAAAGPLVLAEYLMPITELADRIHVHPHDDEEHDHE